MCSGDSASRGGLTFIEGASDKPVSSTSLWPWGRSFDERLTSSARWATAALTTNSPVASTLASVSFFDPSHLRMGEKDTKGGARPNELKKLEGVGFKRRWT